MTSLTANLKCYYQCRILYLWHFIILSAMVAACALMLASREPEGVPQGFGVAYLAATFLIGFNVASLQREILSRPFSFCLPGHRFVPRRLIYIAGAVASFAACFLILGQPEKAPEIMLPRFFAEGAMGMIFYLLGVGIIFGFRSGAQFIGFMYVIILVAVFLNAHKLLESLILYHPFITILLCAPVCVFLWKLLGRPDLARSNCSQFYFGLGDGFNCSRIKLYRQEVLARVLGEGSEAADIQERGFLALMLGSPAFSAGRLAWGAIYASLGRLTGKTSFGAALMFLIICIWFGYWTPSNGQFSMHGFTVLMLCFPGLGAVSPALSTLLLPAGRRERFVAGAAQGYANLLLTMVLASLLCVLSHGMSLVLPTLTARGIAVSFHAIDPGLLVLPLILFPVFQGLALLVQRLKQGSQMLAIMIPAMLIGGSFPFWMPLAKYVSAGILVAAIVIAHGGFAAYLAYVCFRRDLVAGRAGGR